MVSERLRRLSPWLAGAALATCLAASPVAERGFTTQVSERLVEREVARFGPPARERIDLWRRFARQEKRSDLGSEAVALGELQRVNSFFNRVPFLSDLEHWKLEDYWATPVETVASNGADCEDFSIAKYFMLKELGVPVTRLRITYVLARRLNQAHMVLAYYPRPESDPLILDNLDGRVLPASQRPDLVPVYSFNDDDVLIAQGGRHAKPQQIRAWRGLLERLDAEART